MSNLSNPELWARIESHRFPTIKNNKHFVDYIAAETEIPYKDIESVVHEYRRYVYLGSGLIEFQSQ